MKTCKLHKALMNATYLYVDKSDNVASHHQPFQDNHPLQTNRNVENLLNYPLEREVFLACENHVGSVWQTDEPYGTCYVFNPPSKYPLHF